jgi:putative endonuclease
MRPSRDLHAPLIDHCGYVTHGGAVGNETNPMAPRGREPRTRDPRRTLGSAGEEAAASHLLSHGWRLIARNARTRYGEIDIVARDAGALVFVEVKARRGAGPATAELALESIGVRKQIQIRRLARSGLAEPRAESGFTEIRFDVIGVSVSSAGRANAVRHIRAAF